MIQAVADDEERGELGMHYTSVPNILKVLNPLFLDDLRVQLESAGDNKVKLLNLRKRMARIRVFNTPLDQKEIDFENEGGETFICGNPPYKGSKWLSDVQKEDMGKVWVKHPKVAKTSDYVTGWVAKFLDYADCEPSAVGAFVTTNSICQGQQAVEVLPIAFMRGCEIRFAHTSFKWSNLASYNAGVTVVIIGLGKKSSKTKKLYQDNLLKQCSSIGPYLVPNSTAYIEKANEPICQQAQMLFGNMPRDGGNLIIGREHLAVLRRDEPAAAIFVKKLVGSEELINGKQRYCLWIADKDAEKAGQSQFIQQRLNLVAENRKKSEAASTKDFAKQPHRFVQIAGVAQEPL